MSDSGPVSPGPVSPGPVIPTDTVPLAMNLVVPPLFLGPHLDAYLEHRMRKEVLHCCLDIGYVTRIVACQPPTLTVQKLGDMNATLSLTVEVIAATKGQRWRVPVTHVDARMGICVSKMQDPPVLMTILPDGPTAEFMWVEIQDTRIMGKQNMMRLIAKAIPE